MDRRATKTPAEREDAEAERLVRPAPKKKPPRHDKRREQMDTSEDEGQDPDMSLNYKDIGGNVLRRWAAKQKKIPAKSRETGETVFISPDTLKKEPGKYEAIESEEGKPQTDQPSEAEEKPEDASSSSDEGETPDGESDAAEAPEEGGEEPPKKKKPKGKGKSKGKKKPKGGEEGEEPEEPKEPSEAEKAGIAPPQRPEPSEIEKREAAQLIIDSFPPEVAADLLMKEMHPTDVRTMTRAYNATKSRPVKDPQAFAKDASEFFETDPDRVPPPQSWKNSSGERVPFESLSPEEQSEAMRQHQMQVVAMSMAAQESLADSLSQTSLMGKPKIPPGLSNTLASFMLSKGGEKQADQYADQMFYQSVASGAAVQMRQLGTKDKNIQKLMGQLPPAAQKLAKNYFQAADYQEAKARFLGTGDGFDENSSSKDIFRGIKKAGSFFDDRKKVYGDEDRHRGKEAFRVRVLDRLRSLEPDKYKEVRALMDRDEVANYKKAREQWQKKYEEWRKGFDAWAKENPLPFRDKPYDKPPPPEPEPPPRMAVVEPKSGRKEGDRLWEEMQASRSKVASRVARRFISTCRGGLSMGQNANKTGVYHGVDPQSHYPDPYPGWQQAHQRDLGEVDYDMILGSARDWLKTPVLSTSIEGITKDQQFRAALDLAIQSSRYNRQIDANTYNMLLARLAGVPEPGPGETLLTLTARSDSPYPNSLKNKVTTMKASHEVRTMAASAAATNPGLAYELIGLANRLAAQEQDDKKGQQQQQAEDDEGQGKQASDKYASLKSFVIRQAASDAGLKKALTPVLQEIRKLG